MGGSQTRGSCRSYHGTSRRSSFSGFLFPLPSSRQTRVCSPSVSTCISIHPFTVIPFCVTPFPRCRPRYHYLVIYRSTFLALVYFPLLISALFVFGNRLQKNDTLTPTRTRALEPANFWNDLGISILAFIIQAYGSVLSPFSVTSDVGHGSGGGGGNYGKGSGGSEFANAPLPQQRPSPPHPFLTGTGTSTDERGNLSRVMTSVVGSACLRAEGGVGPQLTSHVFGLLKGREAQSQGYEMNEEDRWLATDQGTEWVINTVDSILDVVAPRQNQRGPEAKTEP